MTVTKQIVVDNISIQEDGQINVRRATKYIEDGKELTRTFHHHVLAPADSLTKEDPKVSVIANVVWTPEVVSAFEAAKAAKEII